MRIGLLGAGGMASEIVSLLEYDPNNAIEYLYDGTIKEDTTKNGYTVSNKIRKDCLHIIAVGYPETKRKIIEPIKNKAYWLFALTSAPSFINNDSVEIDMGSVIYPYVVLTSNIKIGMFASINSNVTIGDRVFLGANSCIKEKITICDDVIIGMGAVVVKDIKESGTYVGNPAIKL